MYIIAGLGNPGKKYDHTRHNAGFDAIDVLASRYDIPIRRHLFRGLYGKGIISGEKVVLLKPQTYMNASGDCIRPMCRHFKTDPTSELIVISDDISMAAGRLRTRKSGSAGGHNGLKSIIAALGTEDFIRIKIGVGDKAEGGDLIDHVLGRPTGEDREKIADMETRAADAAVMIITDGPDTAINRYNC